jgi:hypothetical protein
MDERVLDLWYGLRDWRARQKFLRAGLAEERGGPWSFQIINHQS